MKTQHYLSKIRDWKHWTRMFSADIRKTDGDLNVLQLFLRIGDNNTPEHYVIVDDDKDEEYYDRQEAISEFMKRYNKYQCSYFSVSAIQSL